VHQQPFQGSDRKKDILGTFSRDAKESLINHVAMEEQASAILGRKVDLVSGQAIERSENYIRRKAVLETVQPYMSRERKGGLDNPPSHKFLRTLALSVPDRPELVEGCSQILFPTVSPDR